MGITIHYRGTLADVSEIGVLSLIEDLLRKKFDYTD